MLSVILLGFIVSVAAPWICRITKSASGWILGLLPLGMTIHFALKLIPIASGDIIRASHAWIPQLNINLSFYLDGLSLLFALLICGIGTLVVIYTGGYLSGHPQLGRFYSFLLMFMTSMLGLVLADNLITLFVFWELTSLSSYFLIGFDNEREEARSAALQALLVTGIGGLALLAGLLLLGYLGGSMEFSTLLSRGDLIRNHGLYLPILLLILAGAFTKSAQFPFHFWLPNAMEAPAPVSAYLHSSTMVKAGVYLLARVTPILGGTSEWTFIVTAFGAVTMVIGVYLAFQQNDLKRFLAYSTVSVLGYLTMMLGIGTTLAAKAAAAFLLAHALYKGGLFLVAGIIDHETGEKNIDRLGGLGRFMPVTAAASILAAFSMAGFPPLFGFVSKELVIESTLTSPQAATLLTGATVFASMLMVAVAVMVGIRPFIGREIPTPKHPHEAPASLWIGALILAVSGLVSGLIPGLVGRQLIEPAVTSILAKTVSVELVLWHGLSLPFVLGAIAIAGGLFIYAGRHTLRKILSTLEGMYRVGPEQWYKLTLDGMMAFARLQTRFLQSGYLRYYLIMIIATTVGLTGYSLVKGYSINLSPNLSDIRFYEGGLAALILAAIIATVRTRSRLGAVASLGVVAFGIALIFVLFGAPDLAITLFIVETLTVILLVLVLYHLPGFTLLTKKPTRVRDAVIALSAGGLMTLLVLIAVDAQFHPKISDYFVENSYLLAHGRNIVNVILVDFRGIDTLGEIVVLALSGIGVFALLKLRLGKEKKS